MRTSRNDPCPCGSGHKYKKCCLNKSLAPQAPTLSLEEQLIEQGRETRIQAMSAIASLVNDRSRRRPEWQANKFDAELVEIFIDEIHAITREVLHANKHSRHYLYILLRRCAPLLWEELQLISNKSAADTIWFAEVLKAATSLIVQCSRNGDIWEWVKQDNGEGINYHDLSASDLIVVAQIFSLGQFWYEAKVRFRYACKGFRVFARDDEGDALSEQDKSSVERYEARRDRYDTLSGSAGLWYDAVTTTPVHLGFCGWFGARLVNFGYKQSVVSRQPKWSIPLIYFPSVLIEKRLIKAIGSATGSPSHLLPTLEPHNFVSNVPYDRLLSELSNSFDSVFGHSSSDIIAFFYSVYCMIENVLRFPILDLENANDSIELRWKNEDLEARRKTYTHWKDAGQLGILRSSEDHWITMLTLCSHIISANDMSVPRLNESKIREIYRKFTWTEEHPLTSDAPWLFTRLSNRTVAMDVLALADFLRCVLLQANLIGRDKNRDKEDRVGDVTGPWLEDQAAQFFVRSLGLEPSSVLRGKRVANAREIDIAFVYQRTLFVIDCKAMAKDSAFMEGQYNRIRNRNSEVRNELTKKLPHRIALIRQGMVNEIIDPSSFDREYGLVCTSAVEYLPLTETIFWSSNVPLVGPPEELLESIEILSHRVQSLSGGN
jgi:hypothetical protein